MNRADQQDEFGLIAKYFAPLSKDAGSKGTGSKVVGESFSLTDDAALLDIPPGRQLVMTKDMLVAGVHFFADDAPDLIARKLLRVNVSDLAAMGATPVAYLLGFGPTADCDASWIERFAQGLKADQTLFGMTLLGGDSVVTPQDMTFSLTAFGTVPQGQALTRGGARVGDTLYVTGTIGDGALGLAARQGKVPDTNGYLAGRYHVPDPRVKVGENLRGVAHAALDISDGLLADLTHMATASDLAIHVDSASIPLSEPARSLLADNSAWLETIVTGGDDYELAFAAPDSAAVEIARISAQTGVPITAIGACIVGSGVEISGSDGQVLEFAQSGYDHFR